MSYPDQDERDRTVYVSGLDKRVSKDMLHELFIQAGPVEKVLLIEKMQKEADKAPSFTYALVTFEDWESVPFCIAVLNRIALFGSELNVKPRDGSRHTAEMAKASALIRNNGGDTPTSSGRQENWRGRPLPSPSHPFLPFQQLLSPFPMHTPPFHQNAAFSHYAVEQQRNMGFSADRRDRSEWTSNGRKNEHNRYSVNTRDYSFAQRRDQYRSPDD